MTLDEFRKLDAPTLTRAIAEVVCGWFYVPSKGNCRSYFALKKGGKNHCWAEDGLSNSEYFRPLHSIDDAVMCVSKLDKQVTYIIKLCEILKLECEFEPRDSMHNVQPWFSITGEDQYDLFQLINASAMHRCYALYLTVPDIAKRYIELGGKG